jgi:hypothetical protein
MSDSRADVDTPDPADPSGSTRRPGSSSTPTPATYEHLLNAVDELALAMNDSTLSATDRASIETAIDELETVCCEAAIDDYCR